MLRKKSGVVQQGGRCLGHTVTVLYDAEHNMIVKWYLKQRVMFLWIPQGPRVVDAKLA